MRSIAMLDLRGEYDLFREEIRAAVDHVLDSQQFIGGPAVVELEDAIRARFGVGHCSNDAKRSIIEREMGKEAIVKQGSEFEIALEKKYGVRKQSD